MRCLSVKSGVRCHVHLTAKDWIDTCCLRSLVKVNDTKHHSMVCDRCTVHAKLFHSCNIFFYFIRAIQKGKLCMHMEMGKCHFLSSYSLNF